MVMRHLIIVFIYEEISHLERNTSDIFKNNRNFGSWLTHPPPRENAGSATQLT